MRKLITIIQILIVTTALGQLPDSVLTHYRAAKTSKEKGTILTQFIGNTYSTTDSLSFNGLLKLSAWFKKENDDLAAHYMDLRLSYFLVKNGDFSAALNLCFPILAEFQKQNDTLGIIAANRAIANAYFLAKDYRLAAEYSKKSVELSPNADPSTLARMYNGIGCIYGEAGVPDSGMIYAQKAVNLDTKNQNYQQLALSISTLAENYIAAGEYDIALPFLRKSIGYYESKKAKENSYLMSYLKNDFAQTFYALNNYDSTNYYSRLALQISVPLNYKDQSMRSYEYLYKSYEATHQQDSVNKYFRLAMMTKDSLFSIEKTRSLEALSFREQIREQEMLTEKQKAEAERQENIQYAIIAIAIVSAIIIFLFLSHSIITNTKVISFFGVIALLLVFEFLNLLLHPFLERVTHHSPIFMLLALVGIASMLVPLHHKLEKLVTGKLVEKNKAIRLARAKNVIESLESKSDNKKL